MDRPYIFCHMMTGPETTASPEKLTTKVSAMPTNMSETARQKAKGSDGADLYR